MKVQGRIILCTLAGLAAGLLTWFISDLSGLMRFADAVGPMTDGQAHQQQIICMFFGALVGALLGVADGLASGTTAQIPLSAGVGLAVGLLSGLIGLLMGERIFGALYSTSAGNPLSFIGNVFARATGWGLIGALTGTADGWRKRNVRVGRNGFIGGLIGGLIGGTTFEIIPYLVPGMPRPGVLARLAGFTITGAMIGLFVALVQQLLKEAWIRVVVGRNEGKEYLVEKTETKIGRAELSDIPLFGDTSVERLHAVLAARPDGRFVLRDQGSPAGTLVNGARISGETSVSDGDQIQVGGRTLIFYERATRQRTAPAPKDVAKPRPSAGPSSLPSLGDSLPPLGAAGTAPAAPVVPTADGGPRLVATSGPSAGKTFPFTPGAVIGRDGASAISLSGDSKVSRVHARLSRIGSEHIIEDAGSTNGTFVNGQRVTRQALVVGDIVLIGNTSFRLE